jgi:heme/copper-type cytochrome/quinol oxidase subunit 2
MTDNVHALVFWGCLPIAIAVFATMLHSIATFRRPGPVRNAIAETLWALVPIVIVIAMAAPAVKSLVTSAPATETAQQTRTPPGPELAGEIPQKAFHDGGIPL